MQSWEAQAFQTRYGSKIMSKKKRGGFLSHSTRPRGFPMILLVNK